MPNEPVFKQGDRVEWYEGGLVRCTGTIVKQFIGKEDFYFENYMWKCWIDWYYDVKVDRHIMRGVWNTIIQLESDLRPIGLLDLLVEAVA